MAIYTVHLAPAPSSPAEAEVIREGFSWGAFVFGFLWLLYRRLWSWAIAYLIAAFALSTVAELLGFDPAIELALMLAVALIVGFWGNDWRRAALERQGWRFVGVVHESGREAAERRFFDHWFARVQAQGPEAAAASP